MNHFYSEPGNDDQPSDRAQYRGHLYVAHLNRAAIYEEVQYERRNSFFFSSYLAENGEEVPAILSREDDMKLFEEYY